MINGGGGGIWTHEPDNRLTVFKTAAFDHSATPPLLVKLHRVSTILSIAVIYTIIILKWFSRNKSYKCYLAIKSQKSIQNKKYLSYNKIFLFISNNRFNSITQYRETAGDKKQQFNLKNNQWNQHYQNSTQYKLEQTIQF